MTALPHLDNAATHLRVASRRSVLVPSVRTGSVRDVVLTLRPSIAIAAGQHVEPLDDLTHDGLQAWRAALASYVVEMVVIGSRSPLLRWARRELKNEQKRWHDGSALLGALSDAIKSGHWDGSSALDEMWSANLAAHRDRMAIGRAALTGSDLVEAATLHDRLHPSATATRAELASWATLPVTMWPRHATPPLTSEANVKPLAEIWDQ